MISTMKTKSGMTAIPTVMLFFITFSTAQASDTAQDTLEKLTTECATLKDDSTRLACYDNYLIVSRDISTTLNPIPDNSSALKEKPKNINTQITAETKLQQALKNKQLRKKELGEKYIPKKGEVNDNRYTFTLVRTEKDPRDRWLFFFENGQVWRQLEARYMRRVKDTPVEVFITEEIFGSYRLQIANTKKRIKVQRVK